MGAARKASISAIAQAPRRTSQVSSFASRPYSTQRFAKTKGQISRFRRTGAPTSAETPTVAENIQAEPGLSEADAPEPATATGPATAQRPAASTLPPSPEPPVQAGSQTAPPVRKPVDTSSKEYKQAASKYIRFVVAFPVFLVTSYFLWKRRECFRKSGTWTVIDSKDTVKLQITVQDSPTATPSSETSSPAS